MPRPTALPTVLVALTLVLAALAPARSAPAQAPYSGRERVTGVDVLVHANGDRPLRPRQVEVRVDGRPRPVVAVEGPGRDDPWQVVVYVDPVLSDEHQVAWAAHVLTQLTPGLERLGPVELVVADPEPRTVVPAPAAAEDLHDALAGLVYLAAADDALVERRLEILSALAEGGAEGESPTELAAAVAADERRLVAERLDALLLALVERAGATPGGRRLVVLVSGGFDLEPQWLAGELPLPPSSLRPDVVEVGRTLAAYGWLTVALLAPPEAGTVPGLRLGKWRFGRPPGHPPPETPPGGDPDRELIAAPMLGGYLEEDRDPEAAEAHLALAEAHQRAGDAAAAVDEARRALRHFAADPRTADRQARALQVMAEAHAALGEPQKARRALRQAARRDPEALAGHPVLRALPAAAPEALGLLAGGAGGTVARSAAGLAATLAGADRWALVTVQLAGLPDGALHAAEVAARGRRRRLDSPAWLRFGTPERVAAARLRALAGGPPEGDLAVTAVVAGDELRLRLAGLPPSPPASAGGADDPPGAVLRLAAAVPGAAEPEVVWLDTRPLTVGPGGSVELTLTAHAGLRRDGATILAEELVAGSWGTAPVELAERPPPPAPSLPGDREGGSAAISRP